MKKKYSSPDLEIIALSIVDVLGASTYSATPENPGVGGNDDFDGEL